MTARSSDDSAEATTPSRGSQHTGLPRHDKLMRVLSMTTYMPISGVSTWNRRLASYFADTPELGVDWRVAEFVPQALGEDNRFETTAMVDSVPEIARASWKYLPYLREGNIWATARRWVREFADWRDVDVLVADSSNTLCYLIAIELQRRHGHRPALVSVIHNDHESHYSMSWQMLTPGVESVWGVSREIQRRFNDTNPNAPPAYYLPYPVPVPSTPPAKPMAGPLRICWMGRVETMQKRVLDLVTLVESLAARQMNFELHVLGDGSALGELRRQLEPHLERTVFLHGNVPGSAVQSLLGGMHVFVNVSEYEGTSVAMLEAMGQALAPVVTRIDSGAPELIVSGENGWLVPIGDMSIMADTISRLASDRQLAIEAGRRAWERVRDEHGIVTVARRTSDLLFRAFASPRPHVALGRLECLSRLDRRYLPEALVARLRAWRGWWRGKSSA